MALQNAAAVHYMNFKGEAAVNCTEYAYEGFTDISLYRRFRFLSKQGPGALNQNELTEVSVFLRFYHSCLQHLCLPLTELLVEGCFCPWVCHKCHIKKKLM